MMRKKVTFAALVLLFVSSVEGRLRRISIGTNPVGTVYFVIGGGIAKLFTEKLRVPARAVPHAGSSVYLPLLAEGEMTLGLNTSLDSALAYRGRPPYSRALGVRALARVFVMPYAYFVRASAGIERIEDLKGKRVVVDVKGNVSLADLNRAMLRTGGIGEEDVVPIDVGGIEQGVEAVIEGRADAAPIAIGTPLLSQAHASLPGGVRIVALGRNASDEALDSLAPGSRTLLLERSQERVGVSEATLVAAFDTFVNVGSGIDPEGAYLLARTLHEGWESLRNDYPALRGTSARDLAPATNPHPYSDGAVRYFKEVGLWSEANEAREKRISR
jgi:TRAP transporter TAXI family solute receptor